MTDKEKLELIDQLIVDYWEYNAGDGNPDALLGCIVSIVEFKGEKDGKSEADRCDEAPKG